LDRIAIPAKRHGARNTGKIFNGGRIYWPQSWNLAKQKLLVHFLMISQEI